MPHWGLLLNVSIFKNDTLMFWVWTALVICWMLTPSEVSSSSDWQKLSSQISIILCLWHCSPQLCCRRPGGWVHRGDGKAVHLRMVPTAFLLPSPTCWAQALPLCGWLWMKGLCLVKLFPALFRRTMEEITQEDQQTGLYGSKIVGLIASFSEG